jgi:hypothetical protein
MSILIFQQENHNPINLAMCLGEGQGGQGQIYNQDAAAGFIALNALRLKAVANQNYNEVGFHPMASHGAGG